MKTKKYISITLLLALLFVWSCNDFLDEENKTGKTQEMVFSTDASMVGLLASCYSYLKIWYGKEAGFGLSEAGTDLWYNAKDNAQTELVTYSGITPELSTAVFNEYWDGFYAAISQCNLTEKLISNTDLPADKKNPYLAEARFLRAFYYWHLVETWGQVEVIISPRDSISSLAFRDPIDTIYAQMFRDVQFAIDNIPSGTAPSSRVTHWAAKAFMARLALYYASEYGKTEYYAIAAQNAKDAMACPGKSLYDKYSDVWDITKNNTSSNSEFLWAVDYYDKIDVSIPYNNLPPKPGGGNWSGLIARRQITESGGSGGNIMHLMVTPIWQSQSDAVGGAAISADVLRRVCGNVPGFYTIASPSITTTVDVGYWYVRYGLGYTRYAPTRYCLDLFDETMDQRWDVTFRSAWYKHPNVVPKWYGTKGNPNNPNDTCKYPKMSIGTQTDTCLYYSKRPLTNSQKTWASTRYKALDVTNTFLADGFTPNSSTANSGANTMYIMLRKFENTDSKITLPQTTFQDYFSYRDFPVFRLAEMYLIAAEALMDSDPAQALGYVNALRTKRALPGKSAAMQVASIDLNFILEERAREFTGENIRWFDLKRTKKLKSQLVHNTKAVNYFDETKHYLRPIPASMMNAVTNRTPGPDPNGFWQNPGY